MQRMHPRVLCLAILLCLAANALRGSTQEPDVGSLWQDLASSNAETAYRAIWALALQPEQTLPFLQKRLHSAPGERKQIDQLVRDLDSGAFSVREKAMAELDRLEDGAEEALKDALKANPGIEWKRRIESLLALLPDPAATPERVRQYRVLEVLEAIGTKEAQAILERLAKGNPSARWTQLARSAHARLAGRPPLKPIPMRKVDEFGDPLPTGALVRLGTIRLQSGTWAGITPDGKSLVAVSDTALHMWDTKTGAPLSGFPQTRDWSNCRTAAISPDGKLLAVVHRYRYGFEICDLPSGKPRFRQGADDWRVDYGYYCLAAFSQDSKTFCLSNQFDVSYWDVETGRKKHQFTDPEGYHYIASISSTSEKMLTTHRSGLRVRDLATGKIVQSLEDSGGLVQRSQLSADGTKLVATYKPEDRIYAWDAVRGKLLGEIALKADVVHGDPRPSFALSQDGIQLALCDCVAKGNAAQQIQVWNLANLDLKPRILTPPPGVGQVVDFAPDGQTLLWRVGTSYRLLDSATGKDRHGWPSRGAVIGVAWSPDGSRIATGAVDGTVSIWHPDGKRLNTLIGHRAGTGRLVFSPNSQLLVSCGAHKEPAILWDAISGAKKAELDNNRSRLPGVYWAGFSPDSTLLYTGGNSIKRGIFETATGKLQSEFETDRSSTWHMAFSADGRFAAAGIDSIGLYDLVAKRIRHTLDSQQCVSHAFSHDGHTLAVLNNGRGDQGQLVLWETLTGRERTRLAFSKAYLAAGRLAFSPDGRMLAAVASGQFQIWDLASRNPMGQLPGHLDRITCVAFSPDSRSLATGSSDGAVLIHAIAPR